MDLGPIGVFSLTERGGEAVSDETLRGKVWVACFVFVRCTGPCPQVTGTMARLQKELDLAGRPDLRLVTFTVDPERDGQKELQAYADSFRADRERWLFLTGPKKEIHQLLEQGFKVGVAEKPEDEKKPGDEFVHSTRLVVVDRRGHLRGYFDGMPPGHGEPEQRQFEDNLKALRRRVEALLAERP
jgi:cytochrome oxidase Cu insertion factor (SCO1/SenC/PrrC family)